jgi:hypothetical protein
MRKAPAFTVCLVGTMLSAGCTVYTQPAPPPPAGYETVSDGPVVEGPGVVVIDVEPAPVERVYIYDPGYPPGTYYYNGYYYYGGYRYERDVFVHRYVEENVREHRYADARENRDAGRRIEETHRSEYARTGGTRSPRAGDTHDYRSTDSSHRPMPGEQAPRAGERGTADPNHRPGQAGAPQHPEQRPQHAQPRPEQGAPKQMGGRNEQ